MSNQHIENLTIENFKCFKHLEVSNIGRVNLIGGKNNVGKTAFLEAVELFFSSEKYGHSLLFTAKEIIKKRQFCSQTIDIDFFFDESLYIKISSNIDYESNRKECILTINKNFIEGNIKVTSLNGSIGMPKNWPLEEFDKIYKLRNENKIIYIHPSKSTEQDIGIYFGSLTELSLEYFLNNSLSLFDDNILELKPIPKENGIVLKLKLKNKKQLVLLSSLGEGINRYIAILCAIWASKDSVLLIDEIENGIHYTNYKKLWQIIFQASNDANCQVFATTHSKECIEAFNQVQFENENCNAQYFELYRNMKKDGIITASNRSKEQLQYSLTHNGRIRGE